MENFYVIVVAAGQGTRLKTALPKQYMNIAGKPILRHTLDVFANMPECAGIAVVIDPAHISHYKTATSGLDLLPPVMGGAERQSSVYNGLKAFAHLQENDIVLIHDAARPLVCTQDIRTVCEALSFNPAATLAAPVSDTLRYGDQEHVAKTSVERENLWAIQTPQAFRYGVIRKAHKEIKDGSVYTDDTGLVSLLGIPVKFVQATAPNFKITTKEDFVLAEKLLSKNLSTETRTGTGYDVHAFDTVSSSSIRLCGLDVPFDRKLAGHSDADVGLHALTDAILGAIGEGDIGLHFPPSDMNFKNMDSALFLKHAVKLMHAKSGKLINTDVTLICEKPKIGPYRDAMRDRVAEILGIAASRVNIKATTTERLGFTGRMEGIAAQAVVSVAVPSGE